MRVQVTNGTHLVFRDTTLISVFNTSPRHLELTTHRTDANRQLLEALSYRPRGAKVWRSQTDIPIPLEVQGDNLEPFLQAFAILHNLNLEYRGVNCGNDKEWTIRCSVGTA